MIGARTQTQDGSRLPPLQWRSFLGGLVSLTSCSSTTLTMEIFLAADTFLKLLAMELEDFLLGVKNSRLGVSMSSSESEATDLVRAEEEVFLLKVLVDRDGLFDLVTSSFSCLGILIFCQNVPVSFHGCSADQEPYQTSRWCACHDFFHIHATLGTIYGYDTNLAIVLPLLL